MGKGGALQEGAKTNAMLEAGALCLSSLGYYWSAVRLAGWRCGLEPAHDDNHGYKDTIMVPSTDYDPRNDYFAISKRGERHCTLIIHRVARGDNHQEYVSNCFFLCVFTY